MSGSLDRFGGQRSKMCNPSGGNNGVVIPVELETVYTGGTKEIRAANTDSDFPPTTNVMMNLRPPLSASWGGQYIFPILDLDDYSVEGWFRYMPQDGYGTTWTARNEASPVRSYNNVMLGWNADIVPNWYGIGLDGSNMVATFGDAQSDRGGTNYKCAFALTKMTGLWQHLAATFDRDGLARLYLDGVEQDTVDISGLAATSIITSNKRLWQTAVGHAVEFYPAVGMWAMAAFHRSVLSAATIRDSWISRKVHIDANTEAAYRVVEQVRDSDVRRDVDDAGIITGDIAWLDQVGHGWTHPMWHYPIYWFLSYNSNVWYIRDLTGNGYDVEVADAGGEKSSLFSWDDTWDKG